MQIDPVVKRVLQTALHSHNLLLNMPKKTSMPSKKLSKTQVPEASELEEVEIAQSETEEDLPIAQDSPKKVTHMALNERTEE